jgi:parvulin-like peptidyl-prolyl isomerase
VRKVSVTILGAVLLAAFALTGCPGGGNSNTGTTGGIDPNEAAATVNGKVIKLEEVERLLKQQAQGQEGKLSQLELAGARLQILQELIQQEVMFQKAEKEGTVPSEEDITAEYNKAKTQSGMSVEQWDKMLKDSGQTEATARDAVKKKLAIDKLVEKVTGKIDAPKDSEIELFFNGNKESFKNKRGAQLAAIVIDPTDAGQGDMTKNEVEAAQKAKEIGQRVLSGADFATVARESSEEPNTRLSGGDWRYFTEEEMKQAFGANVADYVMNKMTNGQVIPSAIPFEGKILIVKLQRKQEKDEERTLDSPNVRAEITNYLINSRKQLLAASYQAIAMNDAKIVNNLAQKVVNNPNDLSGARPASSETPAASNTNANTNATPTANANANTAKPAANSNSSTNANGKK